MILGALMSTTTVEFSEQYETDQLTIDGYAREIEVQRASEQLDRIRALSGVKAFARVVSINSFPRSTGLSSSGSGFAALTCAAVEALGIKLDRRSLSILARQASGTACRCVCDGFVRWYAGHSMETSFAESFQPKNHWALHDVIAVVSKDEKEVSSTAGHQDARSSPFFAARQLRIGHKTEAAIEAIECKDFTRLGEIVEAEALEFHAILLTSRPSLIAWQPGTIQVMREVQRMRADGIEAYFTINTGFNIHILTKPDTASVVANRLSGLNLVQEVLHSGVGTKPMALSEHLF